MSTPWGVSALLPTEVSLAYKSDEMPHSETRPRDNEAREAADAPPADATSTTTAENVKGEDM